MIDHARPTILLAALLAVLATRPGPGAEVAPTPEQVTFFEAKVRPLLAENCVKCHGPDKQKSGLRLDSRAALLAGGDSGPAVEPGNPEESLLIAAIRHDDLLKMPPSKKLAPEQIAALTAWVQMGAPWPGGGDAAAPRPGRPCVGVNSRSPIGTAPTGPSNRPGGRRCRRSRVGRG
jgi:mono/diheme cytochrome c family protein